MVSGGNLPANLAEGFGCLPNGVIDQHFLKRNRVDRLLDVLHRNPGWFGLGIDESTAAVVQGKTISIVGDSMVLIGITEGVTGVTHNMHVLEIMHVLL